MRPDHAQAIAQAKDKEEVIVKLLTAEINPLNSKELLECFQENPPVKVANEVIHKIALRCASEEGPLKKKFKLAFILLTYLAKAKVC